MLIILSGPPAAGKSTITEKLAMKFPKSASFSIDVIRHFIKGGNLPPWDNSKEGMKQHNLSDKIALGIIEQYIKNKYVVILNGIYNDKDINHFRKYFKDVRGFILLPSLKVALQRDKQRSIEKQIPQRIKVLHKFYSSTQFKNFQIIDNSNQTVNQTFKAILKHLLLSDLING